MSESEYTPKEQASFEPITCHHTEVIVGEKGLERAIKHLKRKIAAEGILRELKKRRNHMKPSIKERKKSAEASRRKRKRDKPIGFDLMAGPAKFGESKPGMGPRGPREPRES